MSAPIQMFPAFPAKPGQIRGFPGHTQTRPKSSEPIKKTEGKVKLKKNQPRSNVEEEYIKNLQQQIYLLELETRYFNREPNPISSNADTAATPLNDVLKGLKMKYVEIQETHKKEMEKYQQKMETMKTESQIISLTLQSTQKECQELRQEISSQKDFHVTEKDKLYGELLAQKKKHEISELEHSRLEKTNTRLQNEKHQMLATLQHAQDDAKKYREQVDELLYINATLKVRVEELHKENSSLQSKLDDHEANFLAEEVSEYKIRIEALQKQNSHLEIEIQQANTRTKQEEHLRLRIAQDCEDLVKSNVVLKNELEDVQRRLRKRHDMITEFEETKQEFNKLKDDYALAKISLDNKDRKINDLKAQLSSLDSTLNNGQEVKNFNVCLLIDDVAELQNTTEIKKVKLVQLMKENQDMKVQIDKFMREMTARKEFTSLIGEIESSGENYLHLVLRLTLDEKYEELLAQGTA